MQKEHKINGVAVESALLLYYLEMAFTTIQVQSFLSTAAPPKQWRKVAACFLSYNERYYHVQK